MIANFEMRIANLKARSEETGVRREGRNKGEESGDRRGGRKKGE
jgi:hypothetical protein